MSRSIAFSLFLALTLVAACTRYGGLQNMGPNSSVQTTSYKAADELSKQSGAPQGTIAVATISDSSMIETSSPLGRMISDQLGARFVQLGYNVSEVRLRNDINVQQSYDGVWDGEYVLSRDRTQLAAKTNAKSVVSGTYVVGSDTVLVNLRMIDVNTARVLAAYDYSLPMTDDVRRLVRTEGGSSAAGVFNAGWAN